MNQKVYTIYDIKVEAYLQPFFLPSKGAAIRAMQDCVSDNAHAFSRHAEDYQLFELGEWDDNTATFVFHTSPEPIIKLHELVKGEVS